jgi:hypothetical protein
VPHIAKEKKGDNHIVSKLAKYAVWLVGMKLGRNRT